MQVGCCCDCDRPSPREFLLPFASDNEEESEGSTPQPSQQRNLQVQRTKQASSLPSQQLREFTPPVDVFNSPSVFRNDYEKLKKEIEMMREHMEEVKQVMVWVIEKLETTGKKLVKKVDKVWKVGKETNESMENIQNQLQKQQNSRTENATRRKRSKEKQKVDPLCRDTFRKLYKNLKKKESFQGFDFKRSFDSAENEEVLKKVKGKMSGSNGSCKWTDEQIKVVGRRYYLSLYETDKKKSDNKYDEHKTSSRRQNRKKQKLKRRTEALDKINWVIHQKGKAAEVLTEEYMSSEVSESEEESLSGDEGCVKEKKLYIRTVTWESEELKTIKNKLDEEYASRQTSRARRREFQRDRRPKDVSSRPKPNNGPSWAFRKDDQQIEPGLEG